MYNQLSIIELTHNKQTKKSVSALFFVKYKYNPILTSCTSFKYAATGTHFQNRHLKSSRRFSTT